MKWLVGFIVLVLIFGAVCTFVIPRPSTEQVAPAPTPPPSVAAPSSVATDDNDPLGLPVSSRPLQILHKAHFTIGYDNDRREPAWVSYALSGPIVFHGKEHRPAKFADDPEVSTPAHHADYTSSGFDRGHMCPAYAEYSRFGPDGMAGTFITSNIIPQVHALNAGPWEDIETMIAGREGRGDGWAGRYGQVFVTDGPVHVAGEATIPGGEPEPSACFMIVERKDGQRWDALAFELPNRDEHGSPASYLVPIRQVERDTGLDFDSALPTEQQRTFEESAAVSVW